MPEYVVRGTVTLDNVVFVVEAQTGEEAKRLVRQGYWDDRNEDEASIKSATAKSAQRKVA